MASSTMPGASRGTPGTRLTSGGIASGHKRPYDLRSPTVLPPGLTAISNKVSVANDLLDSNLYDLFEDRASVLRVPGWIDPDVCDLIADAIVAAGDRTNYKAAPKIGKIADAFYDSNDDPLARARYFSNADRLTRRIREVCAPFLSPLDKLRLRIAELHPPGTCVEAIDGQLMSVGIGRVFMEGGEADAHHDVLAEDAPDAESPRELLSQAAWNTYLRLPSRGGELALWAVEMDEHAFRARLINDYAIDEDSIGSTPAIEFVPEQGELVGFNCRGIHAVRRCLGTRVTVATFTGYRGRHAPVSFWS